MNTLKKIALLLLVLSLGLAFTGCDDDDSSDDYYIKASVSIDAGETYTEMTFKQSIDEYGSVAAYAEYDDIGTLHGHYYAFDTDIDSDDLKVEYLSNYGIDYTGEGANGIVITTGSTAATSKAIGCTVYFFIDGDVYNGTAYINPTVYSTTSVEGELYRDLYFTKKDLDAFGKYDITNNNSSYYVYLKDISFKLKNVGEEILAYE
jgi:hypothetical protein